MKYQHMYSKHDAIVSIGGSRGRPPTSGIRFFHFRIRFRQKAPVSEVGAPPQEILDPPLVRCTLYHTQSSFVFDVVNSNAISGTFFTVRGCTLWLMYFASWVVTQCEDRRNRPNGQTDSPTAGYYYFGCIVDFVVLLFIWFV